MSSDAKYYPADIECAWLASDSQGSVAMLLSAGSGPIAERAFDNAGAPLREIEKQLMQLAPLSDARLLRPVKFPEGYMDAAYRGFFVYDWTDVHKTRAEETHSYELVAVPEKPLHVDALSPALALAAKAVRLERISFATAPWIAMEALKPYRARSDE